MITSIITKTFDLAVLSAKEREQVAAYREQVSDEVVLNRGLIIDFLWRTTRVRLTTDDETVRQLLDSLKDSAFQLVRSGELSLQRVFPDKLKRPAQPVTTDGKGTRQYLGWIQRDKTVSELLRRYYGKIELVKRQVGAGTGRVDVRYLAFMLRVIGNSLKK